MCVIMCRLCRLAGVDANLAVGIRVSSQPNVVKISENLRCEAFKGLVGNGSLRLDQIDRRTDSLV